MGIDLGWNDLGGLTGIATAVLVGVLIWQATLQKKQLEVLWQQVRMMGSQVESMIRQEAEKTIEIQLSHKPYLYVRYERSGISTLLDIVNIGKGHAKDVYVEIEEADNILSKQYFYALLSGEVRPTGVSLKEGMVFKVKFFYSDFTEHQYNKEKMFSFPPKEIQSF